VAVRSLCAQAQIGAGARELASASDRQTTESIEKLTKEQMAGEFQALQTAKVRADRGPVSAVDRQASRRLHQMNAKEDLTEEPPIDRGFRCSGCSGVPSSARMESVEKLTKEQMTVLQVGGRRRSSRSMPERKADQRLINEYRRWASSVGLDLEPDDSRDSSSVSVSDGDGDNSAASYKHEIEKAAREQAARDTAPASDLQATLENRTESIEKLTKDHQEQMAGKLQPLQTAREQAARDLVSADDWQAGRVIVVTPDAMDQTKYAWGTKATTIPTHQAVPGGMRPIRTVLMMAGFASPGEASARMYGPRSTGEGSGTWLVFLAVLGGSFVLGVLAGSLATWWTLRVSRKAKLPDTVHIALKSGKCFHSKRACGGSDSMEFRACEKCVRQKAAD